LRRDLQGERWLRHLFDTRRQVKALVKKRP
jgi:hypothetical protein